MLHRKNVFFGNFVIWFAIVLFSLLCVGSCSSPWWTQERVTFKVKRLERVTTNDGDSISSKYLIYTENETFENTDEFLVGKFNSSDLYGQLDEGKTYTAIVCGWRIPFFSMYRNVLNANLVNTPENN